MSLHPRSLIALAILSMGVSEAQQSADPAVSSWRRNLDGRMGTSSIPNINAVVGNVEADVQGVHFTAASTYVEATGIPSHFVGPWGNNPGIADDQNRVYRIPRDPQENTGAKTATGLGPIGTMVNGAAFFNASDAQSFQNAGIWNQSALFFELAGLDAGLGHPAGSRYHYHSNPSLLQQQRGDNGIDHSPILGFAFDGFPIYGPYGYQNMDGTGGVVRMEPSWRFRNITNRRTLPDGTQLAMNQWGPPVTAMRPLGAYLEDHEFVAGSGDLDEHNGRFGITPEYPLGTYAYFATVNAAGAPAYPFLVGPTYYGVVDTGNIGGGPTGPPPITIPAGATEYTPFSLYSNDFEVGSTATIDYAGATPSALIWYAFSLTGPGPLQTPYGTLGLSGPIFRRGPFSGDAAGEGELSFVIPAALGGTTYYAQTIEFAGATVTLSNAVRVHIP